MKKKDTIVLGSRSPRRRELIKYLDFKVETLTPIFDEESIQLKNPSDLVLALAEGKAHSILKADQINNFERKILLTADTIVHLNDRTIGKPKNKSDAIAMLGELSDRTHTVYTGVNLSYLNSSEQLEQKSFISKTDVTFSSLEKDDIEKYTDTKEPYDKAGSYAIQGLGSFMIRKIEGSYTNVMGLPLAETFEKLKNINSSITK